ncbi:hypothetical protein BJX66DRAFT_315855 [Aspergillus keveii]|uniref:Zn(2)-C6 fungal-type domain-containing protein n=1 Tax=Aspergillus keveii TaxID=714993 RepID=A0ABR4FPG9_9EURO
MRRTLRRSCAACAKFKHSCDLRTPRCSRCIKRNVLCVYANEPLTATATAPVVAGSEERGSARLLNGPEALTGSYRFGSLDPFDSYPSTRLPREHVQRLIHSFLHKIAFQYYPLDLNASSNPFLVSWWPLALGDPALFHVSLQTACLDEELLAQRGFHASEILMADSVALLRRKVEDPSLAVQDGTMNSVITLAAIEFGKGNTQVSQMHVDGVKKLVDMRGGINAVRQTSPLTARMVSWVSMIVMGHPQFNTQDDHGIGDGIPIVPEWQIDLTSSSGSSPSSTSSHLNPSLLNINELDIEPSVQTILLRLRTAFDRAQHTGFLPPTRLHDLTCFVIHRLLLSAPLSTAPSCPATESVRYAIILYMFITHGPTYYSHAVIMDAIVGRFIGSLVALDAVKRIPDSNWDSSSLDVWCTAIGLVASAGTSSYSWFLQRAQSLTNAPASCSQLQSWSDVLTHIKSILWMDTPQAEGIFRPHWDALLPGATITTAMAGCLGSSPMPVSASPLCFGDTSVTATTIPATATTISPRNLSLSLLMDGDTTMEVGG